MEIAPRPSDFEIDFLVFTRTCQFGKLERQLCLSTRVGPRASLRALRSVLFVITDEGGKRDSLHRLV